MAFQDFFKTLGTGVSDAAQGFAAGFQPPADPNAIDPRYGVPAGDVHAANMQGIGNVGNLLIAAGSSMSGADRAKLLMGMQDIGDPTKQLYTMAQARLMNTQVQDAMEKRERQKGMLTKLQGRDISEWATPREQELFKLFVDAGDAEGALDLLARAKASSGEAVMLPDGSSTTKGVALKNRENFFKTFQPELANIDQNMSLATEVMGALDGGVFAGSFGDAQLSVNKMLKAIGIDYDTSSIDNTENLRAAVIPLVLERMSQLGGNDSNEELRTMQSSLAGGSLEPETIRKNFKRFIKAKVEKAAVAEEQNRRLQSNGQNDYGGYVKFSTKMLDDKPDWKQLYDYATDKAVAQTGAAGAGAGAGTIPTPQSQEDFDKLPAGAIYIDPDDGKQYRK